MIAVLGEVMIELAPAGAGLYRSGVAGDTYNTAVMLSQLGSQVCYATALGDDQFSGQIREAMQQHGLNSSAVLTLKAKQPGLYCISNSANGERSFSYWRQQSAARQAFQSDLLFEQLLQAVSHCTDVYWSGITLALMSEGCLSLWLAHLQQLQSRGGKVYFDTNYRAALWRERTDQLQWYQAALLHCDYFLPSLEDCQQIWGCENLKQALEQLQSLLPVEGPVPVICLKAQQQLCWLEAGQCRQFSLTFSDQMLDATGAGDAFSGALIAALQQGLTAAVAIQIAHCAASLVVQYQGAILPDAVWPQLQQQLQQQGLQPQKAKSRNSV